MEDARQLASDIIGAGNLSGTLSRMAAAVGRGCGLDGICCRNFCNPRLYPGFRRNHTATIRTLAAKTLVHGRGRFCSGVVTARASYYPRRFAGVVNGRRDSPHSLPSLCQAPETAGMGHGRTVKSHRAPQFFRDVPMDERRRWAGDYRWCRCRMGGASIVAYRSNIHNSLDPFTGRRGLGESSAVSPQRESSHGRGCTSAAADRAPNVALF